MISEFLQPSQGSFKTHGPLELTPLTAAVLGSGHARRYLPFMHSPAPGRKHKPRALRVLAAEMLGLDIQVGARFLCFC